MRLAAPVRWSATSGAETEAKEMLPRPDHRMAGSGYIVLEAHGVEGRVAHAQGPRPRRQNRSYCCGSRVNPFPPPGIPSTRPSGPSDLRPAAESAPEVARTRPIAPRDRGSMRKVAISGQNSRIGQRRPLRRCRRHPPMEPTGCWPSAKPWHQFGVCCCHTGSRLPS